MDYIPNARGLTEELSTRVDHLKIGQPTESMAPDRVHRLTRYEVFDGDKRLGVVEVNSYNRGSVTRIAHVTYDGVVPGYRNGRKISMDSTELPTLDASDPDYLLRIDSFLGTTNAQNNLPSRPLYRHDGHALRLADCEVDGKKRMVVSEAQLLELDEILDKPLPQ